MLTGMPESAERICTERSSARSLGRTGEPETQGLGNTLNGWLAALQELGCPASRARWLALHASVRDYAS